MWPQPGYRHGYSEGELGEGVLKGGLASKKMAGFDDRHGMTRRTDSGRTGKINE